MTVMSSSTAPRLWMTASFKIISATVSGSSPVLDSHQRFTDPVRVFLRVGDAVAYHDDIVACGKAAAGKLDGPPPIGCPPARCYKKSSRCCPHGGYSPLPRQFSQTPLFALTKSMSARSIVANDSCPFLSTSAELMSWIAAVLSKPQAAAF